MPLFHFLPKTQSMRFKVKFWEYQLSTLVLLVYIQLATRPLVTFDGVVYLDSVGSLTSGKFSEFPTHRFPGYSLFLALTFGLSKSLTFVTQAQLFLFVLAWCYSTHAVFGDLLRVLPRLRIGLFLGFLFGLIGLGGYQLTILTQGLIISLLLFQIGIIASQKRYSTMRVACLSLNNSILLLMNPISMIVVVLSSSLLAMKRGLRSLLITLLIPILVLFSWLFLVTNVALQPSELKLPNESVSQEIRNHGREIIDVYSRNKPDPLYYRGDPFWRSLFVNAARAATTDFFEFSKDAIRKLVAALSLDIPVHLNSPFTNGITGDPNDGIFATAPQFQMIDSCRVSPSVITSSDRKSGSISQEVQSTCRPPKLLISAFVRKLLVSLHKLVNFIAIMAFLAYVLSFLGKPRSLLWTSPWKLMGLLGAWIIPYLILGDATDTASMSRYGAPIRIVFYMFSIPGIIWALEALKSKTGLTHTKNC